VSWGQGADRGRACAPRRIQQILFYSATQILALPVQSPFNGGMDAALIFALMLSVLLVIAMMTDAARYIIPNWLNGMILLLYPLMFFAVPGGAEVDWLHGLYGLGIVFAGGYLLFAFNIMGGGDVKMLAALALWCGFGMPLAEFVLYSAVLGGGLTLLLLFGRLVAAFIGSLMKTSPNLPRVLSFGEPVPYGIAIALGFLIVLWTDRIPGLAGVQKAALAILGLQA